ncbi:hypothetical protein, variant [Fonticula alba]|uniref:Uncharacterized protein n=1 Tax=Fonticula alba TaxID=691883 RepID=A0A058Z1X8_FONAL|nr:hypothetical protein, variant [Fonticula alba]KCV68275.1 hypothetical protein, variant [Fonticula alba]|eukprot:XP_009497329.1 hypothetical protein, variant [Fonticula alba]
MKSPKEEADSGAPPGGGGGGGDDVPAGAAPPEVAAASVDAALATAAPGAVVAPGEPAGPGCSLPSESFVWTPELEILLFRALKKYKPIGIHKHIRMFAIHHYLSSRLLLTRRLLLAHPRFGEADSPAPRLPVFVPRSALWHRVQQLYDLAGLERLAEDEAAVHEEAEARAEAREDDLPAGMSEDDASEGDMSGVSEDDESASAPALRGRRGVAGRRASSTRGGRTGRGGRRATPQPSGSLAGPGRGPAGARRPGTGGSASNSAASSAVHSPLGLLDDLASSDGGATRPPFHLSSDQPVDFVLPLQIIQRSISLGSLPEHFEGYTPRSSPSPSQTPPVGPHAEDDVRLKAEPVDPPGSLLPRATSPSMGALSDEPPGSPRRSSRFDRHLASKGRSGSPLHSDFQEDDARELDLHTDDSDLAGGDSRPVSSSSGTSSSVSASASPSRSQSPSARSSTPSSPVSNARLSSLRSKRRLSDASDTQAPGSPGAEAGGVSRRRMTRSDSLTAAAAHAPEPSSPRTRRGAAIAAAASIQADALSDSRSGRRALRNAQQED